MAKIIDRVGFKFGRWTVQEFSGFTSNNRIGRRSLWLCACECGNRRILNSQALTDGASKSCGCLQKERVSIANTTHGGSYSKLYKQWTAMKSRCHNEKDQQFFNYGARGIRVCDEWRNSFDAFTADVGEKPDGLWISLDRIDNSKGYEPGNVRWVSQSEQMSNTRRTRLMELNGETLSAKQWSVRVGIKYTTLMQRINSGWDVEKALTTPVKSS